MVLEDFAGSLIVAKCPSLAGTVPAFRPMFWLAQNSTYVLEILPVLSKIHASPKEDTVDVAVPETKTKLNFSLLVKATTLLQQQHLIRLIVTVK